ncbi:GntR family transcriptional regulator [Planotetraspora kaengkrachanensis]|uniref:HTH-type transcriptional repressor YvoA n=1 Tax=Planotetraspora kaengkrachanensis TaxID=575193 RepID=A0A8J3LSZ9_9ACTN|nr:GntR family transcriptional regulator [Planotetraspora kaengkrachanensis]GIG78563.1 HTH-type transcriptional repressor YvoA [Planotetraspora kaengkrachanensis]
MNNQDESHEARYQEIERWLRDLVLRGAPGDALPSESDLAQRFGVSRMTARQAMQNLAQEGLISRRRGAGSYIAQRPLHRRESTLMSFTDDMRRRGVVASSQLLDARLRSATAGEIEALRLPEASRVVAISRIRLADGVPLAVEHVALPAECAGVLAEDLESGSLHEYLHRRGWTPALARSWIGARVATPAEVRMLDMTSRGALLVERRIIYDQDHRPFEHTETAYVAERYVIDATFAATGSGTLTAATPT